ncbi:MAG: glutamate--tRNA ligase [Candidatus Ryanbacteria bacterium CG10_big_fil_rev_8_21_14_0_10_43_42]|uniref:Glutamate--tRNA ligase n=1 Tax=Candidatus Ryanbacteria bacterium CG10_big_fil_rev_8_21_14_0_10_43_42 TaxID=1974864 RepID=A0A2M8KW56_9BACT|nr:MAG: glutamate--tRNA ligase [Candidatus Ryanbacteria bacterium CG10_big_fil_rev_8_21_14_0_10_43_42]
MIRTRMAPSPTGWFHVGTARTALFNYLFTRKNKGIFVLRIEDTDKERSEKRYEEDLISNLAWLGITWDELYRQSERTDLYEKHIINLLTEGKAFYCAHTKEELDAEKHAQMQDKKAPHHRCSHRDENRSEGIIRFRNDTEGNVSFDDSIRGTVTVNAAHLGDFSIAKNVKTPLFNLANVVDDVDMNITHVIRGEDHIPNTPRQILLFHALAAKIPLYAHLPLILGTDRSKLSKRHGETSLASYKEMGFLSEALINFMALLGWSPGNDKELFSMDELIKEFSLEHVQKSGAIFNQDKLTWINEEYIRALSLNDLMDRILPFLKKNMIPTNDLSYTAHIVAIEQSRLKTLSDITTESVSFFFNNPEYDFDLLPWKGQQDVHSLTENLSAVMEILHPLDDTVFSKEHLETIIMPLAKNRGIGETLWPLRVALSGRKASPGPFEIMSVIGKKITMQRIEYAQMLIQKKLDHMQ